MGGRLFSCGSVVIYLLICVIVLHFSGKPRMAADQVSLQFLEAGKSVTQVNVNFPSSRTTKLSRIPTSRMEQLYYSC